MARELKMVFMFFTGWRKKSRRLLNIPETNVTCQLHVHFFLKKDLFHGRGKLHEIQIPVSINKILLECSHAPSFTYNLWLLLFHTGRVEYLQQRSNGPQSLNYLLPVPLQKNFTDPWIGK